MRCLFGSLCLTILLINSAWADTLILVGTDVEWSSKTELSPTYYVSISNENGGVVDRLASWQLTLVIQHGVGAKGDLYFNSADLPENYLLDGDSLVQAGVVEPPPISPGTVFFFDNVPFGSFGNEVPASAALLKLDFYASENAAGVFEIAVVTGRNSLWGSYDTSNPEIAFGNVPLDDIGPVVIGSVNVLIPEPHGFLLLLTIAGTWAFGCRIGRIRGKR